MSDGNVDVHTGPALARMPCATCGVETLHRGVRCVHCGHSKMRLPIKLQKRRRDFTHARKIVA